MASYTVIIVREQKYIDADNERYESKGINYRASEVRRISVNIDMLIDIIKNCEEKGLMIRRTLEALVPTYRKEPLKNAALVIGRIVSMYNCWSTAGSSAQLAEAIVTDVLKRDFGKALIRCYQIAMRFNVIGSTRCDDRYRYWVHYRMDEDSDTFVSIVLKGWYGEKQKEYALKNIHLTNAVKLVELWDEYFNEVKETNFEDLNNYLNNTYCSANTYDKVARVVDYLHLLNRVIDRNFSGYATVDGTFKRIKRTFPSELLIPKVRETYNYISSLLNLNERMYGLVKAEKTLDNRGNFNFYCYETATRSVRNLYDTFDQFLYYLATLDMNLLKFIKSAGVRTLHVYQTEKSTYKYKDNFYRIYGYACYGVRYSRMPRHSDTRMKVFI